jgi:hypothetical protein
MLYSRTKNDDVYVAKPVGISFYERRAVGQQERLSLK